MRECIKESKENNLPVIGMVMKSLEAEIFQNMQKWVISYVERRGDLNILSLGTQSQTEVGQQICIVNKMIENQVDAIIIVPIDSIALVPPLAQALEKGIKVISLDVMLDQETLSSYHINPPFIGPDNYLAARMVGNALAEELGPESKVIIIDGIPNAKNAQQRRLGFLQSISDFNLNLLASESANWEREEAKNVFREMLLSFPEVQGVLCANDAMALGVIQAIELAGLSGQIKVVGIDNDISIQPYLQKGNVLATVDLLPREMAALGIDYAMESIRGEYIPQGWIKTPMKFVSHEDFL